MLRTESMPVPVCADCLPEHRGDWEVRPNPYLLTDGPDVPCAFCGSARPSSLLAVACPVGPGARAG